MAEFLLETQRKEVKSFGIHQQRRISDDPRLFFDG